MADRGAGEKMKKSSTKKDVSGSRPSPSPSPSPPRSPRRSPPRSATRSKPAAMNTRNERNSDGNANGNGVGVLTVMLGALLALVVGMAVTGVPSDATVMSFTSSLLHWRSSIFTGSPYQPSKTDSITKPAPVSDADNNARRAQSLEEGAIRGGGYVQALDGQDPKANDEAVVVSPDGAARFTVLTDRLIRMEYSRTGEFEDAATFAFVNRKLDVPEFSTTVEDAELHPGDVDGGDDDADNAPKTTVPSGMKTLHIRTAFVHLQYVFDPSLTTHPSSPSRPPAFSSANLFADIVVDEGYKPVRWHANDENEGKLPGTLRTLDNARGAISIDCDTLHPQLRIGKVSQLCSYGLVSRSGWVVVDDTQRPRFDNDPEWPWVQDPPSRPMQDRKRGVVLRLDWYMFGHGLDYRAALADFVKVSMKIAMPPRYGFGVFFSRWWPFSDTEVMEIINDYQAYAVPLDVSVQDMDWHLTCYDRQDREELDMAGQPPCWTGHTFDYKYFPNPKRFMDWCEERGIKNSFNLHLSGGVQPFEANFTQMAESMGIPATDDNYVAFNIVNKTFAVNYHKHMLKPIEEAGMDTWWLDWQQGEDWFSSRPGYSLPDAVHPTWYLNYVFATQPDRWADGSRPMILHRWGGLGCHRFSVGFSGDVYPSWTALAFQPFFTSAAANVGFGYWSHDIGGFMLPADGELYTRWIQFGAMSPVFRTHGSRVGENVKRMWLYGPEYFPAMREALHLRMKLLPYIYTSSRRAFDTGISIVSPLYYEWPRSTEAYEYNTQYMFGEDMMVAPVVKKMVKSIKMVRNNKIWIPEGEWIDWHTGSVARGPGVVNRTFTLFENGIYVRSGAIIVTKPIGSEEIQDVPEHVVKGSEWLGRSKDIPRILEAQVFLPATYSGDSFSGETYHYEDDGDTQGHLRGEYQWTRMSYTLTDDSLNFKVHAAVGTHPLAYPSRSYTIRLRACVPPTSVSVNGREVAYSSYSSVMDKIGANTWHYDGAQAAVVVMLFEHFDVSSDVDVQLHFPPALQRRLRPKMDGLAGHVRRALTAKKLLDMNGQLRIYPSYYDHVTHLSQVGVKLSFNPEKVVDVLEDYPSLRRAALEEVKNMDGLNKKPTVKKQLRALLGKL